MFPSIIDMLLETTRTCTDDKRRAAASLLCAFVTHTRAELGPHVPQLLRGLILLLAEQDRDVLQMAWEALAALTKTLDADRQIQHVADVRQAVRYAASDLKPGELLPGFCLPKVSRDEHCLVLKLKASYSFNCSVMFEQSKVIMQSNYH